MNFLADTVVLVRFFSKSGKIGRRALSILLNSEEGKSKIFISIVSFVEIMYLSEKNRINLNLNKLDTLVKSSNSFEIKDLDFNIISIANEIKKFEMFDRLIIATAKYLNVPLITCDEEIINSKIIKTIWD